MLNKRRVIAAVVVVVTLIAGLSMTSTFEAGANPGHPQKKLFDSRWYQDVIGGDYQGWMSLSTSQPWLSCGSSESDCGSRWLAPLNGAVNDWNAQETTVELVILPDQNIYYDVNVEVMDLIFGDPFVLGIALQYDLFYDFCFFSCTIWFGWALISDLGHIGDYGTANSRQGTVSHEIGHLLALRHESVNADESVLYPCEVDDTGTIPRSIMSYNCIDPVSVGGQGIYAIQTWDTCGVNHAYYDPTIGYSGCGVAAPDADGDGVPDASDNCPEWPNPSQELPPWSTPASDSDCDGYSATNFVDQRASEAFLGTDPADRCADTATWFDERGPDFGEPLSPWPPDINDDGTMTLSDVLVYSNVWLTISGQDPGYDARYDLNGDGRITVGDVLSTATFFLQSCDAVAP